ncbi:CD209 antigen-like protein C isoform X2 [Heterodontus francisci]|uniref:CD209 antigen-like protein C isoform X2 n=1 Tax=Heterodontus francisci TaxID=7792 RepID=UPI00355B7C75
MNFTGLIYLLHKTIVLNQTYQGLQRTSNQLRQGYSNLLANLTQINHSHGRTVAGARKLLNSAIDNGCSIACPSGWSVYNKTCYYFSTNLTDWFNANKSCARLNATLVIVKTPGEQDFIANLDFEKRWIGLTDLHVDGVYRWVNGDPLVTGFWARGEPNNPGVEHCVTKGARFDAKRWNDDLCTAYHRWICEVPCFVYLAWEFGLEAMLNPGADEP